MKNLIFCAFVFLGSIQVLYPQQQKQEVPVDRWFEIDLFWFEKDNLTESVDVFWERFHPIFNNVKGEKGVILNIGWVMDCIFSWSGNLREEVKLPKNMLKHPMYKDEGFLYGNTEDRRELAINRFTVAGDFEPVNYDNWTYKELKKLVNSIRKTAQTKYNIKVRVGCLFVTWETIYGGEETEFTKRHPSLYENYGWYSDALNVTAKLNHDTTSYGAYPQGIKEGTLATEFFGNQWGHFSKTIGLDALVIRDSGLGPGIYERTGPFGKYASPDPGKVAEWSTSTANLVKYTKLANPDVFVMGYSNGCTAMGDWRVNSFDLESIAKDGYLDAYIDQSWAGAWNEVGQRPNEFWNRPQGGYTYQMAYILTHAAVLADTKCKHYFLTETFDSWESWDVIHAVPDRLKWEIWAYSHAAVKTPAGLKMPAGSYISWANQMKRLLTEKDVAFVAEQTNEAFLDAYNTEEVYGSTLVYCRSALEWQNNNLPNQHIKEWIDEQSGTLMKFSLPIMSSTRIEYLPEVKSDLFIFQTPVHLNPKVKKEVISYLKGGNRSAIFGSPANGVDKDIQELVGITTKDSILSEINYLGSLKGKQCDLTQDLPNTFLIFHPFTKNEIVNDNAEVFYYVNHSPALVQNNNLIFWDPAELYMNIGSRENMLADELMGSIYPWALTSRLLNRALSKNGKIHVDHICPTCPVFYTAWKTNDGKYKILAAQLEEGLNHNRDKTVKTTLNIPEEWKTNNSLKINYQWGDRNLIVTGNKYDIQLSPAEVKLLIIE